ncbi:hypothetical protein [Mycolicibacterium neoaurum]|uniref:hypothetical protein n=1 Tax=Mycolicibacterium neoaurum TaxID=1795 RepID=UPI001F4C8B3B|nr:hypothetical protein [Mycolicibacterium neoaurum]
MNDVFNTLLEPESRDPEFARAYAAASARIAATDTSINTLDEARCRPLCGTGSEGRPRSSRARW